MPKNGEIAQGCVERLSVYRRTLRVFFLEGKIGVSSRQIADMAGVSPETVRKDLAFFGNFGKRGAGYNIDLLSDKIESILGVDRRWKVALVGFGKLGQALIRYKGFSENGFDISAIFEIDEELIGGDFDGIPILHSDDMLEICERETILLAVVAVSSGVAHDVFQRCFDAGIRGIMNFTDYTGFKAPPHAKILNVNISIGMESLSYFLKHF